MPPLPRLLNNCVGGPSQRYKTRKHKREVMRALEALAA